ncbi:PIN domain-containing protein [Nostocoides jenkinsii]|uniref:PIN domain-containing protein n=1 Tax=Nostocoides jenkinsii TaxID=330834 RepID=UPI000AEE595B|nr:PIN domain-containing protein [Tetrasphaera jenkinsii]
MKPKGVVVDTSALLAFFDANEPQHEAVVEAIQSSRGPLIVSPYVIAELDYLVMTRHGVQAQRTVLNEIAGGAWELAHMDRARLADANRIVERFADIPIGVADASNVVLAEVYGTRAIVTLDRRHFTILRFDDGSRVDVRP